MCLLRFLSEVFSLRGLAYKLIDILLILSKLMLQREGSLSDPSEGSHPTFNSRLLQIISCSTYSTLTVL